MKQWILGLALAVGSMGAWGQQQVTLPPGGTVTVVGGQTTVVGSSGTATIPAGASNITITTPTIDWSSFKIGQGASVQINPGSSSVVVPNGAASSTAGSIVGSTGNIAASATTAGTAPSAVVVSNSIKSSRPVVAVTPRVSNLTTARTAAQLTVHRAMNARLHQGVQYRLGAMAQARRPLVRNLVVNHSAVKPATRLVISKTRKMRLVNTAR